MLEIELKPRQAQRLTSLISERNNLSSQVDAKNEIIGALVEGHMLGAGADTDAPHGNARIDTTRPKTYLIIDDAPASLLQSPRAPEKQKAADDAQPPVAQANLDHVLIEPA